MRRVTHFLLIRELSFSHMPGLVSTSGASKPGRMGRDWPQPACADRAYGNTRFRPLPATVPADTSRRAHGASSLNWVTTCHLRSALPWLEGSWHGLHAVTCPDKTMVGHGVTDRDLPLGWAPKQNAGTNLASFS